MGYMSVFAPCAVCRRVIDCNPYRVPSLNGEPICEDCMVRINQLRTDHGLEEIKILPGAWEAEEVD